MIPDTIPLSSIDLGERGRTIYTNIEALADSIVAHGLIQPIVLVSLELTEQTFERRVAFGLDAGGRRYHALKYLGVETLHHAVTSEPDRYGFVLKGADQATPLQRLFTEIAENLDRDDMDWRDEVKLITKAWRLAKAQADSNSEKLLMRDFGAMLGCGYADLQAANEVHDDLIAHPERYKDVTGLRMACSKLIKINANELTKLLAAKSLATAPLGRTSVSVQAQPEPKQSEGDPVHIPLTQSFIHTDSISFMKSLPDSQFDHIVTDPDYAVSVERLEASMADAGSGVNQESVTVSLETMNEFLTQSFRLLRDQSFCVFWYDLDHHEKLQQMALDVGFRVQRWPLIWVKSDYRSNASPQHNFCKNIEYAMVCRKPGAVLARVQMSSVFTGPSADTVKQFNHPFAKPVDLWKWVYGAVAIKGQTSYDPFLGSGTSGVAAAEFGLRPMGSEIDIDHYSNAILNIQVAYRKLLGENVRFT